MNNVNYQTNVVCPIQFVIKITSIYVTIGVNDYKLHSVDRCVYVPLKIEDSHNLLSDGYVFGGRWKNGIVLYVNDPNASTLGECIDRFGPEFSRDVSFHFRDYRLKKLLTYGH
jgi:hypothetical protein